MKKNYIIPETNVYEIGTNASILLSGSLNDRTVDGGDANSFANEERTDLGSDNVWNEIW